MDSLDFVLCVGFVDRCDCVVCTITLMQHDAVILFL